MTAGLRRQRGFTLVELVVVVLIVAILATVGMRSYRKSVLKSNRDFGMDCLVEAQKKIENYYSRFNKAVGSSTGLSDAGYNGVCANPDSKTQLYTVTYTAPGTGNTAYTLTATGIGKQAQDGTLLLVYDTASGLMVKQHITPAGVTLSGWQFTPGK